MVFFKKKLRDALVRTLKNLIHILKLVKLYMGLKLVLALGRWKVVLNILKTSQNIVIGRRVERRFCPSVASF